MGIDVNVKDELNDFYVRVKGGVSNLIGGAAADSAVIFNATGEPVTFFAYNYVDTVYWIPAQKTFVPSGKYGTVAASGEHFKIHPNDNENEEYLVEPGKAYVYAGRGELTEAE